MELCSHCMGSDLVVVRISGGRNARYVHVLRWLVRYMLFTIALVVQ